jgi:molecular chaperone DnaK
LKSYGTPSPVACVHAPRPSSPRSILQIEVTFDIDANGIVNVGAKDKGTGREQNIVIQSSGGLAKDEVDRMVREAEQFAAADKKKKDFIDAKNDADSLVYSTEKSLAEHRSKVSADDAAEIEAALKDTKKALEGDDGDVLRASTQKLQTAAMKIGTAMYKNTGGSSSSGASSDAGSGAKAEEGRTVDAETSEPKDKK